LLDIDIDIDIGIDIDIDIDIDVDVDVDVDIDVDMDIRASQGLCVRLLACNLLLYVLVYLYTILFFLFDDV